MKKRALILGGSSGFGQATVKKIATTFDEVLIIHRDRKRGVEVLNAFIAEVTDQTKCTINAYNVDATDEAKVRELIDQVNEPFDLVLHAITRGNLGSLEVSSEKHLKPTDFQLTMEAMCFNVQMWNSLLLQKNLLKNGSRFITLTSEGSSRIWPGYGAVAMAKSAMETLIKYLAVEMSPRGIRYTCLHAGVTDTPSLRLIPNHERLIEATAERNPYKRLTKPEDVANMIYLLTLPEASWVNGTIIHVDGGEHLV